MNIKILGVGCTVCQSMYNTVTQIVAREHMEAEVEYVTDARSYPMVCCRLPRW